MKTTKLTPVEKAKKVLSGELDVSAKQHTSLIRSLVKISGRPSDIDSRICFGIEFYDSEAKAEVAHLVTRLMGNTYNGGWFHGMPCGRDKSFDYTVKQEHLDSAKPYDALITQGVKVGTKLYAVTI